MEWRRRLTTHLHDRPVHNRSSDLAASLPIASQLTPRFATLLARAQKPPTPRSSFTPHRYFADRLFYWIGRDAAVDHPDQRIAADARLLCDGLGALVESALSGPLLIAIYTRLTLVDVGWVAPAGLAAFYLVGLTLSRALLGPVARAVLLQQERRPPR